MILKAPRNRFGKLAAPPGDRLAKSVGKSVNAHRERKKLTFKRAAHQLGISERSYKALEAGTFIPAPWLVDRIRRWKTEGKKFNNASPKKTWAEVCRTQNWQEVKARLPFELVNRLFIVSSRLGITQEEFIVSAILARLDDDTDNAAFEKARVLKYLEQFPEITAFLREDKKYFDTIAKVVYNEEGEVKEKEERQKTKVDFEKELKSWQILE